MMPENVLVGSVGAGGGAGGGACCCCPPGAGWEATGVEPPLTMGRAIEDCAASGVVVVGAAAEVEVLTGLAAGMADVVVVAAAAELVAGAAAELVTGAAAELVTGAAAELVTGAAAAAVEELELAVVAATEELEAAMALEVVAIVEDTAADEDATRVDDDEGAATTAAEVELVLANGADETVTCVREEAAAAAEEAIDEAWSGGTGVPTGLPQAIICIIVTVDVCVTVNGGATLKTVVVSPPALLEILCQPFVCTRQTRTVVA